MVIFTKHALEKFKVLRNHRFSVLSKKEGFRSSNQTGLD